MGNGLRGLIEASSVNSVPPVLEDVVEGNGLDVWHITRAANSVFFMPWTGVRVPEGVIEGSTPERIYETVERVAKFWNYLEDSLSEILAKPLGDVKSALTGAREDLADLFIYMPYGALMRIEHYIDARFEQAKTAIKGTRNIRNVSSAVADFISFPLYAIAALPFWDKRDRRLERRYGKRVLRRLGYEIRGDDVFKIRPTQLNGHTREEAIVARLRKDTYNIAYVLWTEMHKIEPALRNVGYVDIKPVDKF